MVALILQGRFCSSNVGPDVTAARSQAQTNSPPVQTSGTPVGLTGVWEMSVQKKSGGVQFFVLAPLIRTLSPKSWGDGPVT